MAFPIHVKAIFDIGKTNKKFLLFDDNCSIVYQIQTTLEQDTDDDGYPCEHLESLVTWIKKEFHKAVQQQKYQITDLNFSTYGATMVHLDRYGNAVTPIYNYLKPYPEDVMQGFYNRYGGRRQLSLETASPPMGMLNSGLQLYWLKKKKPEKFAKIHRSLHLPQYISYLFTGNLCSEFTSIGCHTAMWNYKMGRYHDWIYKEGMDKLLPGIQPVSFTRLVDYDGVSLQVGTGIHDSSAALVPFLFATDKPFIQLSTGTWSIAINPFTSESLSFEELEQDCLNYLNIYGKPVKASRLFLGHVFTQQLEIIGRYFGRSPNQLDCQPDALIFQKLVQRKKTQHKTIPEINSFTGVPHGHKNDDDKYTHFNTYEEACHQLMLDLVWVQLDAMRLVRDTTITDRVIITGGFSQNEFFTRLLASYMPAVKVCSAAISEASALGAMLVIANESQNQYYSQNVLEWKLHKPFQNLRLEEYR